jgi:hypothetical protein
MHRTGMVSILAVVIGVSLSAAAVKAPMIEITPMTYKCGTFQEGKTERLKASFVVKNTGDAILRLEEVRPGCGCTVVQFDSLIAPGKTGLIDADVNIANSHSGALSKTITVHSNAQNESLLLLTITATIQAPVDISDHYLNMQEAGTTPAILFLSSQKKNLKVTDISFKSSMVKKNTPDWQKQVPVAVPYKLIPIDSVRTDGFKVFKLEFFKPKVSGPDYGDITIKTNHPDQPTIVIQANIGK